MIRLDPLGDRAWLALFGTEAEARGWVAALRRARFVGVVDVVLAYQTVGVFGDPDRADPEILGRQLLDFAAEAADEGAGRVVTIPAFYDGEDLPEVAERLSLRPEEVAALHSGRDYRVLAVGFLPGFPYAGDLAPGLAGLARRAAPRPRVPAGSIAIAGKQTGVYPRESPGGWHLLGRTPLEIADAGRGHFPIRAGDLLRFVPIDAAEYQRRRGELLG